MSRRYEAALVFTLKLSVSPTLTLICVAKPWIDALPAPDTSHVPLGVPGLLFSHAIGFTSGAHGSAEAGTARIGTVARPSATAATRIRVRSAPRVRMTHRLQGSPLARG